MNKAARIARATAGLTVALSLLPACGSTALGTSKDAAPADLARDPASVDSPSTVRDDLAPASPDLATTADLARDNFISTPDLPPLRDTAGDPTASTDGVDVASRDLFPGDPVRDEVTSPPDLPADGPPVTDLRLNFDQPPSYDLIPPPDELPAREDALAVIDAGAELANECVASGGTVNAQMCCIGTAAEFRDTCTNAVGACGCSPTNSVNVRVCTCPSGGCFLPGYGCVGPASTCTVGMDQTCNDSLVISSIHGKCVTGGRCLCTDFALSASSGKCL